MGLSPKINDSRFKIMQSWAKAKYFDLKETTDTIIACFLVISTCNIIDNSILECQVCLERVDIDNLMPLSCFHVFHPNCLKQHIKNVIKKMHYPIKCPTWSKTILEREMQVLCNKDLYQSYQTLMFKHSLNEDKNKFMTCPTPNWGSKIIVNEPESKTLKYWCQKWSRVLWVSWRENWHEGQTCKEYRKIKGYPIDDQMYYRFIMKEGLKRWVKCSWWVEKPKWCSDLAWWWNNPIWKQWEERCLLSISSPKQDYTRGCRTSKQPIHSYSAKPSFNNKYYKYVSSRKCKIYLVQSE